MDDKSLTINLQNMYNKSKEMEQDTFLLARKAVIIFDGLSEWMNKCPCTCDGCSALLDAIKKAGEI